MNEPAAKTVCRVCGTAFATAGDGFGEVCLGCLLGAALGSGDASESSALVDATPPPPGGLEAHGAVFAHYEITTHADGAFVELGRGAMGVTYRAVDTILHHEVALKVVAPDVAGNPQARARFLREAQAAASLRHSHIASVFFFGERPADRQLFYAMELIEGETLQTRVARAGGLPAEIVLEIGTQIADALATAEARGLTHRDLKPANVMLGQGEKVDAKVIDFGLAKTILPEPDGATRQTSAGEFVGTPAFASPEHFNVWQDMDSRSDFYALGATLWYALTGQVPFVGRTPAEVRDRQLHVALPVEQLRAARVPRPVVDLLRSLLSPDPAGRPQTARALAAALADCRQRIDPARPRRRWRTGMLAVAMVGVILAGTAGGLIYQHGRPVPNLAPTQEKSIAVLPFNNLSADQNDAFFTNGVQDEILTDLGRISDLKVISRNSVLGYVDPAKRPPDHEIGRTLGVAYLLEGSVQRLGDRVHLTVRLNDAAHDRQFWSESFDRNLADIFALQSEVATTIVGKLQARLSGSEKAALDEPPTRDLAAYELYLHAKELFDGTGYFNGSQKNLPDAVRLLNEAVARDPGFLAAYCLLARAHDDLYWDGFDQTPTRLSLAQAAIEKAAALRPDAGEVHLAQAVHLYHGRRDLDGALRELDQAVRTLPNNNEIYLFRGSIVRRHGRWEDSTRDYEKGLSLNPQGIYLLEQLEINDEYLHRYADEARHLDSLLALSPRDPDLRAARARVALRQRADLGPAYTAIPPMLDESQETAASISEDAMELALCGRDANLGARALAANPDTSVLQIAIHAYPHAFAVGMIANLRHDADGARAAFEQARAQAARKAADAPDNASLLSALGVIDAMLGRRSEAVDEGERAVAMLPVARDAITGTEVLTNLVIIYANLGMKPQAIDRLAAMIHQPCAPDYGLLRLEPYWDPLRGDKGFESLVASLAPKP